MIKRGIITVALVVTTAVSVALAAHVFSDVPDDHWAATSIMWANEEGIMTVPGEMPGMFDPAGLVNRAQLATTLQRLHNNIFSGNDSLREELNQIELAINNIEQELGMLQSQFIEYGNGTEPPAPPPPPPPPPPQTQELSANLTGTQEVPPVDTAGMGTATLTLTDNDLAYTITVQDLSGPITSAHFHDGAAGVDGGVLEPITFDGLVANGTWMDLTADEMTKLEAEGIYINVHTEMHPDGEIRGQVMMM